MGHRWHDADVCPLYEPSWSPSPADRDAAHAVVEGGKHGADSDNWRRTK
jgi:hypothetical protein